MKLFECTFTLNEDSLWTHEEDFVGISRIITWAKLEFGIKIYGFSLLPQELWLVSQAEDERLQKDFVNAVTAGLVEFLAAAGAHRVIILHKRVRPIADGRELFSRIKDIEFTPVAAGLAASPVEYRFGSCYYRVWDERNAFLDPLSLVRGMLVMNSPSAVKGQSTKVKSQKSNSQKTNKCQ